MSGLQREVLLSHLKGVAPSMIREPDLLQIRVSVFESAANDESWRQVANSIVTQALQDSGTQLPVCGILLFSSSDWCADTSRSLPKLIRTEFQRKLGYESQLIGGSMPRLFASVPQGGKGNFRQYFLDRGVIAVTLFCRDMWFAVRSLEEPFSLAPNERRRALSALAKEVNEARGRHMGLGSSVQLDLLAIMPGPVVCRDEREFRDEELHSELLDAFKGLLHIFGGSAGDSLHSSCGYQFANDRCLKSGLAIALMENDLEQSATMGHGMRVRDDRMWSPVTQLAPNSLEPSYYISELGGRPAPDVLNEWAAMGCFERGRPILGIGTNPHCQIAATSEDTPLPPGPVRFSRRLPLGTPLFVMRGDDVQLREAAVQLLEQCRSRIRTPASRLRLFFGFCCLGRFIDDSNFSEQSWRLCMQELGKAASIPMVCFLCTGEFAEDHRRRPRADSYSLWISCLSSSKGSRSDTRVLQHRLLEASTALVKCETPDQVMDAAIDGAIRAGAEGGQVCLADKFIDAILGFRVGRARNKPGGEQRWDLVIPGTIVRLPNPARRLRLPEALRSGSICLGAAKKEYQRRDIASDDDILEIAATEHCALFIPDSANPEYHCDQDRVHLGKICSQLVAPLIGSGGDVIGTLQVGFALEHPMDRTKMGLWVSFSQQAAAALERALEREERHRLEVITDASNRILQSPTPVGDVESLFQDFTKVIKGALEASYVHMRVAELQSGAVRYRLVAPIGSLGDLHREVRPYISDGEGSVRIAQCHGSTFTNRHEDTSQLYADAIQPSGIDCVKKGSAWNTEAGKMRSAGVLELRYRGDFLGALVVDSNEDFFFTERRKRITEVAAQKATVILAKLRAEKQLQQVVHTGLYAANNIHAIMRPLCLIQRSADLLLDSGLSDDAIKEVKSLESAKNQAVKLLVEAAQGMELGESLIGLGALLTFAEKRSITVEWRSTDLKTRALRTTIWLRSAVESLAENAREAAFGSDGVSIRVWEESRGLVFIEIENDGELVTLHDVHKMWTVGYTTKPDHLGLGIPLANFGIRLAGGELSLAPRSGGGLQARISLPLATENTVTET